MTAENVTVSDGSPPAAEFTDVRVCTAVVAVRFPSAEDFLWAEVAASPLVGLVAAMDDRGRAALERAVVDLTRPYADDDGITFPMQTWLVTVLMRERGRSQP